MRPDSPTRQLAVPAAERLVVRVLGAIGIASAIFCAGAWLSAPRNPDRRGQPVEIDLATLGDAAPALGAVTLIGAIDVKHVVRKTVDAKGLGGRNLYAAINAPSAPRKSARIFVEEYVDSSIDHPLPTGAGNRFKGVLVEDGLPSSVLGQFKSLNIDVAVPHYLLLTGRDGIRTNYYIAAGLCGFVALICLLPLGALFAVKMFRAH